MISFSIIKPKKTRPNNRNPVMNFALLMGEIFDRRFDTFASNRPLIRNPALKK